jgi:phosphate transport system substrate-binding protein
MNASGRGKFIPVIFLVAAFVLFGLIFTNIGQAGQQKPVSTSQTVVQGTIRISGAWALYPMMVKWAEEYKKIYPKVRIDISAGGAGKGIVDALNGLVDIGMVSREIRPEEVKRGAFYVPVVKDAVFPTINQNNPVLAQLVEKGLRKKTFVDLWISGQTITWGEISGTSANQKVRVYTRSDSCGAAETWAKYLGKNQEDLKGVAVYGDPGVAEAVRKDKLGIGFNNLNYAFDMKTGNPIPGIQVVPIDVNENGKIDPEEKLRNKHEAIEAVVSGVYPSPPARDLYLIAKGKFKVPALDFVKWILSDGQRYVNETGYLKIKQNQSKEALKKLDR